MEILDVISLNVYDQEKDKIRDMIGIQIPFRFPYYLFFSVEDLTDESEDNVYFVGYEMKSPGPAFWGYVDKENYKITIFGSCWYRTNLLNDMVKQWKKNNLKYAGASIRNKIYPRSIYNMNDLEMRYKMGFSDFEEEKYMASYLRNEITKKDLPKDLDEKKLDLFLRKMRKLDNEDLIEALKKIDEKNHYEVVKADTKSFRVPKIITVPDYDRYKAFYALLTNKITRKQFERLYPWEYTLDILDSLLYDFFGYDVEVGSNQYFWDMYVEEKDLFLGELYNQIQIYEKNMNSVDGVYRFLNDILNEFFKQIQTRKLKITPSESCPKISECMTGDIERYGEIDTSDKSCMVYYYPYGYKRGNIR